MMVNPLQPIAFPAAKPAVAALSTRVEMNSALAGDQVHLTGAPAPKSAPAPAAAISAAPAGASPVPREAVPTVLSMEEASPSDEISTPALGTPAYWTAQARHMTDFFSRVSVDTQDGGFYTHIDADGQITNPDEKFLMPTSRQVHAYAAAFRMTGDLKDLALAKHGVDFILQHHVRRAPDGGVYFVQRVDKKGELMEGEAEKPLLINEQTYGLTGLIGYYRITRDPQVLEVIQKGHEYLTKHFSDPVSGGFFDSVDPATGQPDDTKSYNSTIYPATSALLELAEVTDGELQQKALAQVKELGDLFVEHFPDPQTGFIVENFTSHWQPDWRGWQSQNVAGQNDGEGQLIAVQNATIGVGGHNTQGALFLLRADRLLRQHGMQSEADSARWTGTARTLVDSMLDRAYDAQNGGWHDVFIRETGQKMWHTNKPFWQQEEGFLATLAMARLTGEARYQEATGRTLEFWHRAFLDKREMVMPDGSVREVSFGDRQTVAKDGTPLSDPKGAPGKSSYHSVEMATLAQEIDRW
jgi:mannose/cellobiose epimerase-like protein (N-acyl-D-glucosamine 2-epimerase family)